MKTEPREVRAEARLGTGHAKVRDHGEAEPAADRRPVHRRDDRLLAAEQADGLGVQVPDRLRLLARTASLAIERAAVAEIGAGAERLALRREHDRAAIGIRIKDLESL